MPEYTRNKVLLFTARLLSKCHLLCTLLLLSTLAYVYSYADDDELFSYYSYARGNGARGRVTPRRREAWVPSPSSSSTGGGDRTLKFSSGGPNARCWAVILKSARRFETILKVLKLFGVTVSKTLWRWFSGCSRMRMENFE